VPLIVGGLGAAFGDLTDSGTMNETTTIRLLAAGRVAVGTALTLVPGTAGSLWFGDHARDPGVKIAVRALGVRDAVLGLGTLWALANDEPTRAWYAAGAASDVVDAIATMTATRRIGLRRAVPATSVATTSAVLHTGWAISADG